MEDLQEAIRVEQAAVDANPEDHRLWQKERTVHTSKEVGRTKVNL